MIDKLLKKKTVKGKEYYLVSWRGWSTDNNTWEPKENINPKVVKEFEKTLD